MNGASGGAAGAASRRAPEEAAAVLRRCVLITLAVGLVELAGGLFTGSLSLVGDAGHMLTDGSGLVLAYLAAWSARRAHRLRGGAPPGAGETAPREAWAALVNAGLLLALVAGLARAALARLETPTAVLALPALGVAALGLGVNVLVLGWLRRAQPTLSVRAAFWHVVGDLVGSVAALASGALLALGAWPRVDAVLALAIAALLLVGAVRLALEAVAALRAHRRSRA